MNKDLGLSYLCWLIGVHYLYLARPWIWILYLMSWGGFGIWALLDFIRMNDIVRTSNRLAAERR